RRARRARGRPRSGARRLRDRGRRPHRRARVVSFTGERLPGADADFAVDRERHLAAYRFARAHAAGRAVLDAGSGEGYGAALLAEVAARVVGIDRAEAVRVAAARHRAPGLRRLVPAAIARRAFPPLARLVRRRLARGDRGAGVGPADFTIGPDHLDTALDLVVVSGEIA